MTTTVALTGTGIPFPGSRGVGPGVLVGHGKIALQFDAGRATMLRLAEAGVVPGALTAVFLTHVHRDHVLDLLDLAMTRWLFRNLCPAGPLPVVAAAGEAADFVTRMLAPSEVALSTFPASKEPAVVWHSADRAVTVRAVAVHHEPVKDAVAYRIDTPDAAVVISGDTRVCAEVEDLARGADLLVHEACRATARSGAIRGADFEKIFGYHAGTVALGALAERAGVRHTVLTRLIPPPGTEYAEEEFEEDLRSGGYTGRVTVGTGRVTAGCDLLGSQIPVGK